MTLLADRIAARRGVEVTRSFADNWLKSIARGPATGVSGVSVTAERALGVTSWYSGARYLSESVSGLPVHTYRDSLGERSRRADPPWLVEPDEGVPWLGLVEHWMMSLLHRGNAYAYKRRDSIGRVIGLRPIHPDRVRVGRADDRKVFKIDKDKERGYTSREILHIPGISYDGLIGLDPISLHRNGLGTAAAADEFAGRFFGQGDHTRAYISVPETISDDEAKVIKGQWEKFHRGMLNAHEMGVLGNGAEYKTVGLDPQQTQLLETRQFEVLEVARILRIPPHKLYELTRATFSNIEHQSIEAVTDSVRPWVQRFEAHINLDPDLVPGRGQFVEFQLEGLLRGDTESRYKAYQSAVGRPWMRGNEARRLENLPPIEGLDEVAPPANAPPSEFDTPEEVVAA